MPISTWSLLLLGELEVEVLHLLGRLEVVLLLEGRVEVEVLHSLGRLEVVLAHSFLPLLILELVEVALALSLVFYSQEIVERRIHQMAQVELERR